MRQFGRFNLKNFDLTNRARGSALVALASTLALAACATTGAASAADDGDEAPRYAAATPADGPFASTYQRYPGRPTALEIGRAHV